MSGKFSKVKNDYSRLKTVAREEMGDIVKKNPFFFMLQVLAFTFWPLAALIACSSVLTRTYNEASTLYFNPFSYNQLMPSAFHIFSVAISAFMFIYRGISCYYFDNTDEQWIHTGWLLPSFPLYAGGLLAWCYDQPWITFGLTLGAMLSAFVTFVADGVAVAKSDETHKRKDMTAHVRPITISSLILVKLPVIALVVFFYFEAFNAMFGAATTSDPDLAWNVNHWFVLIHSVFVIGAGSVYFLWYHHNFLFAFITAGVFITNAIVQRDTDPTGYLWVVTLAFAIYELIAGSMVLSFVINELGLNKATLLVEPRFIKTSDA